MLNFTTIMFIPSIASGPKLLLSNIIQRKKVRVETLLTANEDDPVAPSETEIDDRIFESNNQRLTRYHNPVEEIGEQHQTARQDHGVGTVARYNHEQNIHQDPRSE